ncbi:MAG: hypothetical protein ABSG57_05395 [Candidatus Bathyarchaeia archaeon]|jgi:hypothetical protein
MLQYFWVNKLKPIFKKIILFSTLVVLIGVGIFFALTYLYKPKSPSQTLPTAQGVYDGFQLTMTLEKTNYTRGEPVNITLTLTNISNQTASVFFDEEGGGFDFQVYNSTNSTIYPSLNPGPLEMSIPLGIYETLDAKQSWTTYLSWGQGGVSVSGTYYIVGQIGSIPIETTPLQITIS